jgi:hypothetical protein
MRKTFRILKNNIEIKNTLRISDNKCTKGANRRLTSKNDIQHIGQRKKDKQ